MNHSPFEDWLLNDDPITPEQQHELDLHLRECGHCSALAETGVVLKNVKMVAPAAGFTNRFQMRLAEHKMAERRKKWWGTMVFILGGLILITWLLGPLMASFLDSPAAWISMVVGWLVFLDTTFYTLLDASLVILNVIKKFMPPFAWLILLSMFAGMALLWSVSIWRFIRMPRGV